MERRLLTFIVASTAFFFVYITMRTMFVPPPQPPAGGDPVAQVDDPDNESADPDGDDGERPEAAADADPQDSASQEGDDSDEEAAPDRPEQPSWFTLGSMSSQSGHFMLVTLTDRGAGIERIELTERKEDGSLRYRRVDVRHGYLGYLAATSADNVDGLRVNVIGPGTPAEAAGLQVGDVLVAVGGELIATPDDLTAALTKTKPGDVVSVEVLRGAPGGDSTTASPPSGPPLVLSATLSEHPLDLVRLARDGGDDQIVGNNSRLSCLMTLGQVNRKAIRAGERSIGGLTNPTEMIWSPESNEDESIQRVGFSLELSDAELAPVGGKAVRLRRSYALAPGSYSLDLALEVENLSDEAQDLAYRLEGPNGITLEGWWYSNKISPNFSGAAARDIVYKTAAEGHRLRSGYDVLKWARSNPKDADEPIFADGDDDSRDLKYICVDAQYFTVGYVPPTDGSSLTTFRRAKSGLIADESKIERHKERAVNCTFFLDSVVAEVPPRQSLRQELRLFAGPKKPEVLEPYGLGDCIYYGWFALFAGILAGLLHVLSGVGNYAVAIIILTLIVRGLMFPLSRKAAVNAQRMQELAPELKKIADQYKDDMEGRLKAQRELQQRVGFNPLAGCLPMFLQLPIFIGLYRALSVDIELRQEALSSSTDWASNLAGPDMFLFWGDWLWEYLSGRGTGWLGPYFNILPVLVVVLFLAQQKMFMPPATDEQTAMTQKMMSVMTLMMGLFFFRVPAGLCIYFITSSLWGICERILVKKTLPSKPHFDTGVIDGTATPTQKSSIVDRIRDQVNKPEAPIERPNKRRRPPGKKKN